jgi:hypothetical protein
MGILLQINIAYKMDLFSHLYAQNIIFMNPNLNAYITRYLI